MSKLLGSIVVAAALVNGGAAFACDWQKSAAADSKQQTAQAPAANGRTAVPPASTSTPKTTDDKTGG